MKFNNKQRANMQAYLNKVIMSVAAFRNTLCTEGDVLEYVNEEHRIKLIEAYLFMYRHPELVAELLQVNPNKPDGDTFFTEQKLMKVLYDVINNSMTPDKAIKHNINRKDTN